MVESVRLKLCIDTHKQTIHKVEQVARSCLLLAVHCCFLCLKSENRQHVCTWCVQVLRSPKEAFAAVMQSWRERCEKCVRLQGDYVEK